MTMQELEERLRAVCEIRKDDFAMTPEKRREVLDAKYPMEDIFGRTDLCDRIQSEMKKLAYKPSPQLISTSQFVCAADMKRLSEQLYLKQEMFGIEGSRCRYVIDVLRSYLIGVLKYPVEISVVDKLFHCAVDLALTESSIPIYEGPNGDELLERQVRAARRLRPYMSEEWEILDGQFVVTRTVMEQLQVELERRIAKIGGQNLLRKLYQQELWPQYDERLDRYLLVRPKRGGKDWTKLPQAAIPCNYLMHLALKHLEPPAGVYLLSSRDYDAVISYARDMMTVMNLSNPEGTYEVLLPTDQMIRFITDGSQYDSLCIPFQYSPDFCQFTAEKIYLPFMKQAKLVKEARAFPQVLRWCLSLRPMTRFTVEDVKRATGLGSSQIESVLKFCAQDYDQINRGFYSLGDRAESWDYPLIRLKEGNYLQVDPHFCGYAFCECLYRELKSRIDVFDRTLGLEIERRVKKLLDDKSMPYKSGNYRSVAGTQGECDLILEGKHDILFLELKKRPLPESFQQGDSVEILRALGEGMVYGEIQALKHRQALEQDGKLILYHDLKDKAPCAVLCKQERRIYTMAVCLPEYAFFTTAVIAQKVLMILEGSVSNQNPDKDKRLDKFNHLGSDFRALFQNSGCSNVREYVRFSAFRSLQQLWTVWRTCEDGDVETLIQRLLCDCSVATYNVDFYHSLKGFDYFSVDAQNDRV